MKQPDKIAALYNKTQQQMSPLARKVYALIRSNGSITGFDGMRALGIGTGSMTRRITELRDLGFPVKRVSCTDKVSKRRYGKYSFEEIVS